MLEQWFVEVLKGIGRFFLNPLIYWSILLIFIVGFNRVKEERKHFGFKVFDFSAEWKRVWLMSAIIGMVISLITIGTGFVFSYETILILAIVSIFLSITFKLTLLSASYTIGLTYFILFLSPLYVEYLNFIDTDAFLAINFTGLTILLGLFLIVEAIMLRRIQRDETFPMLTMGNRGLWIGQHHLKKVTIIPFFVLVPAGLITPIAPFWPYFSIGSESYSLLLVPFLLGFNYIVRGNLPQVAAREIAKTIAILGFIVILLGAGSIYFTWLSIIAVFVAIIGREFINYKHQTTDRDRVAYFNRVANGLKVLAVMPGTPGDRFGILAGETITKVNDQTVNNAEEFYIALQESGAYFKIDILNDANEIRFVQGALYEGDHHKLGLLFTETPHHMKTS